MRFVLSPDVGRLEGVGSRRNAGRVEVLYAGCVLEYLRELIGEEFHLVIGEAQPGEPCYATNFFRRDRHGILSSAVRCDGAGCRRESGLVRRLD